ncbi:MAG: hypothetical protein VZR76_03745 [Candidatus Enteromonas sp.]|nr:hypothetical protein [Bacilli bacterium]MBQ4182776.1 hypothetical protein [Bacilli bacterium]MEE3402105.1 hypothetical protein [Candidatus Enteromonas sp.]MEE3431933.1 hypothetical protein [Candidatus Enteromonas sp.]MEE3442226.1 hypothetical protein [Candidatus Enteromonas sp.]
MSYKFSLLLSMFFLVQVFLYAGDLACIESIHSQLDAISLTASYQISMQGGLNDSIAKFVYEEAKAKIYYTDDKQSYKAYGESVSFYVSRDYIPFVISDKAIAITVRRSAVIGYFQ